MTGICQFGEVLSFCRGILTKKPPCNAGRFPLLSHHPVHAHEHGKECETGSGKIQQIPAADAGCLFSDTFERNQACHGRNQCAESAEICADNERGIFLGKARQEQRGRYIADNLTGCHGGDDLVSGNHGFQKITKYWNSSHIPDEHKKSDKCQQQRIIHTEQDAAVCKQYRKQDNAERNAPVHKPCNRQQRQHKQHHL